MSSNVSASNLGFLLQSVEKLLRRHGIDAVDEAEVEKHLTEVQKALKALERRRPSSRLAARIADALLNASSALSSSRRLVDDIKAGSRVTIVGRDGRQMTGKAVMFNPKVDGWVLNMGGRYGKPAIATDDNVVSVRGSFAPVTAGVTSASRGTHIPVKDLPPIVQRVLKKFRYNRRDIEVIPSTTFWLRSTPFEGNQAYNALIDLKTDAVESEVGSWGGANPFTERNLTDRDETSRPLRPGLLQVKGEYGGRGSFARIYVNPETMAPLLPSSSLEVTPQEKAALRILRGIKSGYRADEFARERLGPYSAKNPLIQSLIEKGLVRLTGAGLSITTQGKNASLSASTRVKATLSDSDIVEWLLPKAMKEYPTKRPDEVESAVKRMVQGLQDETKRGVSIMMKGRQVPKAKFLRDMTVGSVWTRTFPPLLGKSPAPSVVRVASTGRQVAFQMEDGRVSHLGPESGDEVFYANGTYAYLSKGTWFPLVYAEGGDFDLEGAARRAAEKEAAYAAEQAKRAEAERAAKEAKKKAHGAKWNGFLLSLRPLEAGKADKSLSRSFDFGSGAATLGEHVERLVKEGYRPNSAGLAKGGTGYTKKTIGQYALSYASYLIEADEPEEYDPIVERLFRPGGTG